MSMPAETLDRYRRAHRRRDAERARTLEERRLAMLAGAERAAELLRREHGATRVVLFGSVLDVERFHARSDLDIAVEGVRPDDFWAAGAAAERAAGFELDLIDLGYAKPELRDHVQRHGREL